MRIIDCFGKGLAKDKEHIAIARLQEAARTSEKFYKKPLVVTTSGGKDSSVCVELAIRAGIDFELMHNHTTADAPATVRFIRSEFKRLEDMGFPSDQITITYPIYEGKRCSMWSLIPQKRIPPSVYARYCCVILKEQGGQGRYITTGVRWSESAKRKNSRGIYEALAKKDEDKVILNNDNDDRRKLYETCMKQRKAVCNPIIDWTDCDVWDFLADAKIPVNPLYENGFTRVGCIGCPLAKKSNRIKDFAYWPGYKKLYIYAFDRMLEARKARGLRNGPDWDTGEDVFHWWMKDGVLPGQMSFDNLDGKSEQDD